MKEDEQAAVDDHEEERRDMYLLTIQCHARDALDELEMLYTEMSMLNMREDEEDLRALTEFSSTSSSSSANIPNRAMDPNRPGISITRTYKVGDQLMMR